MTEAARKLLVENPELCKEIAGEYSAKAINEHQFRFHETVWTDFVQKNTAKKDCEILSYKSISGVVTQKHEFATLPLDYKTSGYYAVHSVRRLSDSEVFTISDTVETNNGRGRHIIDCFKIIDGRMCVQMESFPTEYQFIELVQKPKPALFTTNDGKEVFEGDVFYCVTDDFQIVRNDIAKQSHVGVRLRAFSTIPAAEEYILWNNPCLNVSDIIAEIYYPCNMMDEIKVKLIKLAKSKL